MRVENLALTGALLFPCFAWPQSGGNWIGFASSSDAHYSFNLDRTQVDQTSGGRVFITWMQSISKAHRTLGGKQYHRTLSSYRVWCDTTTLQNLQMVWYDKRGNVLASDPRPQLPALAIPDSIGDQLAQEVCSVMGKR